MEGTVEKKRIAWQPLTPQGVAAFAGAGLGRLLLIQFLVALVAAGVVVWFVSMAWFPIIEQAIYALPTAGEIRARSLDWPEESPVVLAENRFLALTVDLKHEGQTRSPAHLEVEFGRTDLKIFSLLGYVRLPYPAGWVVAFNRVALVPWWGAWKPPLLALIAAGVIVALMLSWSVLATLYFLPAWFLGFFANRNLTLLGSWRLSGAALMPGALFLSGSIFFYGVGVLDLIRLGALAAAHFVLSLAYVVISTLASPRHPAAGAQANPFETAVCANFEIPSPAPLPPAPPQGGEP